MKGYVPFMFGKKALQVVHIKNMCWDKLLTHTSKGNKGVGEAEALKILTQFINSTWASKINSR